MDPGPFTGFIEQVITGVVVIAKKHASPHAGYRKKIIKGWSGFDKITVPGSFIVKRDHHILGCHGNIPENIIIIVKNEQSVPVRVRGLEAFHKNGVQDFIGLRIKLKIVHGINGCIEGGIDLVVVQWVYVPIIGRVDGQVAVGIDAEIDKRVQVGIFFWVVFSEKQLILCNAALTEQADTA
jgi:hypothetical protein